MAFPNSSIKILFRVHTQSVPISDTKNIEIEKESNIKESVNIFLSQTAVHQFFFSIFSVHCVIHNRRRHKTSDNSMSTP